MPKKTIELYVHNTYKDYVDRFSIMGFKDCLSSYYEFFNKKHPIVYVTYETQPDTYGAYMFDLREGRTLEGGIRDLNNFEYIGYLYEESVLDVFEKYFTGQGKTYREKLLDFFNNGGDCDLCISKNAYRLCWWQPPKQAYPDIYLYIADTDYTYKVIKYGDLEDLLYPTRRNGYNIFTSDGEHLYDTYRGKKHKMKSVTAIAKVPNLGGYTPYEFAQYCHGAYASTGLTDTRKRFNTWLINLHLINKNSKHGKIEFIVQLSKEQVAKGERNGNCETGHGNPESGVRIECLTNSQKIALIRQEFDITTYR